MANPFRRIEALLRAALREWPVPLAILGLASLLLLPRAVGSGAFRQRRALEDLRLRARAGDRDAFEASLRDFLRGDPPAHAVAEARSLAADFVLRDLRAGEGSVPERAAAAWGHLLDVPDRAPRAREVIGALLSRGYAADAAARARELPDPRLLALALAEQSRVDPRHAELLLQDARAAAAGVAGAEGILLRARVEARAGQPARALELVAADSGSDPRLRLERGRLLARLDRKVEALAALDPPDESLRDEFRLVEAELFLRAGSDEAARLAEPLARGSGPLAPAARVLRALSGFRSEGPGPLASALAALPTADVLEPARLDLDWIHGFLDSARRVESRRDRRLLHAQVLAQLARLQPGRVELALELGALWRRAGEPRRAAEAYAAAADSGRLEGPALRDAVREAADASAAAGDEVRAATWYRRLYELDPRRHSEALFRQGECLARAGHVPGALAAFAEYLDQAGKGDPRAPQAILQRGRLLALLGEGERALAEFERVLREDLGISPRTREWEEALLSRGRLLAERSREEARRVLSEYLERYASEDPPREGSVEAAVLLARAAIEDRDLPAAQQALSQALALPASLPGARALQREARQLEGDVLLAQGRYAEAEQSFARAGRGSVEDLERLGSLVGRGRALARLGRASEALDEYRRGVALFERARAPAREAAFWRGELDALGREVR